MRKPDLFSSYIFGFFTLVLLSVAPLSVMSQSIGADGVVNSGDGVLNVRSGPSTNHEILHVIPNFSTVTLRERKGDWGRIEVCCATYPLEGWVYLPLIDFGENAIQERHDEWVQQRHQCPPQPRILNNCVVRFSSCETFEDFELMRVYAGFDINKPAFYPFRLIDLVCEARETEILELYDYPDEGVFGFRANESSEDVVYWFNLKSEDPSISRGTRIPSTNSNRSTSFLDYLFGDGTVGSSGIDFSSVDYSTIPEEQERASSNDTTGIARSSGGWVTVDGKTIGRTWVSYGYNIMCSRGYRDGHGSNSVLGGSFKADVDNMDEATAVLLQSCRR